MSAEGDDVLEEAVAIRSPYHCRGIAVLAHRTSKTWSPQSNNSLARYQLIIWRVSKLAAPSRSFELALFQCGRPLFLTLLTRYHLAAGQIPNQRGQALTA